jgi:hypothetical protein
MTMDYLTIAASIVTSTLVPLFETFGTKALEEVGKKTGEEVFDKRKTILEKVKDLFVGDDLITLNLLGKYPDNEDIQKEVTEKLETKLKEHPEIATSLEQINQRIVEIENIDITKSKLLNKIKMARDSERKVTIKNKGIEESEVENTFEET